VQPVCPVSVPARAGGGLKPADVDPIFLCDDAPVPPAVADRRDRTERESEPWLYTFRQVGSGFIAMRKVPA
jgi:hypothetical protein